MLNRLRADLASAWNGVLGGRLASLVAVLALAVGIGASVTAAAVAYGGLLKPLPFPDADRLLSLEKFFVPTNARSSLKLAEFDQWRERLGDSLALTGYAREDSTLRGEGQTREVSAAYIVDNWFQVLQAAPEYGRLIDGNSPLDEAVVSRQFADRESPGNPSAVLGRSFTLGTRPLRVVGVLPSAASVVTDADVWTLARGVSALAIVPAAGDSRYYLMVGRVPPGQSEASARAAASAVLASLTPDPQKGNWRLNIRPLRASLLRDSRPVLVAFLAASALVLLVACANVAMLLVNRAVARSREFAVRIALGASRGRLLVVATMETAMLAIAGAAGGWGIARFATALLQHETGLDLPAVATLPVGGSVSIGAVAAGAFVVAVCGAAPLVTLRQAGMATSLRSTTTTSSRASRRMRGALVVSQLAMTVVLVTGAGLLGRTLLAVSHADLGLDATSHVVTMPIPIRESTADAQSQLEMVQRVLGETRRLPGVVAAGIGGALPPTQAGLVFTIRVTNDGSVDATRAFDMVPATDGYFEALGARLVDGRFFTAADMLSPDPICVMSESALKHLALVTKTTVGTVLNLNTPTASGPRVKPRIVGVVRDVRYSGLDAAAHGGVYILWRQLPRGAAYLVARTTGDPKALTSAITRIVHDADPSMPINSAVALSVVVDRALAPRAARFSLVGVFAVGAALLGIIGLSGALIRSGVERQRELAIRSAIGATPRRLLMDVFRHGAVLTSAGIAIGLAASALMARAVSAILYGVTPHDPITYVATSAAVLVIALIACYLPARRAAAADPVLLLRSE
jgi:putative ABC transport system permease protein